MAREKKTARQAKVPKAAKVPKGAKGAAAAATKFKKGDKKAMNVSYALDPVSADNAAKTKAKLNNMRQAGIADALKGKGA